MMKRACLGRRGRTPCRLERPIEEKTTKEKREEREEAGERKRKVYPRAGKVPSPPAEGVHVWPRVLGVHPRAKTPGHRVGLRPCLLKSCPSLVSPIFMIFDKSLRLGRLPQKWKLSEIVPLFKKGSRSDPLTYRLISLTSVCCKSLERIIVASLVEYLKLNEILSSVQFGFRRGRTVDEQLLLVDEDVTAWLDEGFSVDVVLFYFSKSFDVAPHAILVEKFSLLGVTGQILEWIEDFLVGRQMKVTCLGLAARPNLF